VPRLRVGNLGYCSEKSITIANINSSNTSSSMIEETNLKRGEANNNNDDDDDDELGWDANKDFKNSAAIVVGCSLLGSVFLLMRIELKAFKLLNALQNVLEKWPTTKPCLGKEMIQQSKKEKEKKN